MPRAFSFCGKRGSNHHLHARSRTTYLEGDWVLPPCLAASGFDGGLGPIGDVCARNTLLLCHSLLLRDKEIISLLDYDACASEESITPVDQTLTGLDARSVPNGRWVLGTYHSVKEIGLLNNLFLRTFN